MYIIGRPRKKIGIQQKKFTKKFRHHDFISMILKRKNDFKNMQ